MATIMNKLYQPVSINLSNGGSVHFLARETKKVPLEVLQSVELQLQIKEKNFVILSMQEGNVEEE